MSADSAAGMLRLRGRHGAYARTAEGLHDAVVIPVAGSTVDVWLAYQRSTHSYVAEGPGLHLLSSLDLRDIADALDVLNRSEA